MYTSWTLLTTAAALSTSAMALPHQERLAESEPWHLFALSVFTSSTTSTNNSISFDLIDNNAGLQASTTCSRSVLGSVEDANIFYPCDNNSFNFRWDATYQDSLDIAVTEMVA
ncbi:unnamed protein product [Aureobasidium uvarum]|uniref:AA1-like domain-containing protein n=1 Tax=Aureobasidium uvarum TaxID=2773716 RepID=A0A9N8PRQ2_9PEZI|nr:unnamed protein product [Aureobasidium uvarum]